MRTRKQWRLAAMMALVYAVQGSFWPLLAVHLADLGIRGPVAGLDLRHAGDRFGGGAAGRRPARGSVDGHGEVPGADLRLGHGVAGRAGVGDGRPGGLAFRPVPGLLVADRPFVSACATRWRCATWTIPAASSAGSGSGGRPAGWSPAGWSRWSWRFRARPARARGRSRRSGSRRRFRRSCRFTA